jgi:hypothetical protein
LIVHNIIVVLSKYVADAIFDVAPAPLDEKVARYAAGVAAVRGSVVQYIHPCGRYDVAATHSAVVKLGDPFIH